ncbi:hypothetical protein [Alkalihalobacillus sp. LMS39]|uniref:hypothetical protein n=1 Tax=Alkalihalobacillus sp. LMS39 TaxID=2924032 RepID=UPI001FB4EA6D|nr:hypothetical protein [Alkalihalobacillus sp. LMS39]UOE95775.1 hypothetical protein MM271_09305 [Alkalihalobacillus sp. LMS39]
MTVYHFIATSTPILSDTFKDYGNTKYIDDLSALGFKVELSKKKRKKYLPKVNIPVHYYENEEDREKQIVAHEVDEDHDIRTQFQHPFVYYLSCEDTREGYNSLFQELDRFLSHGEWIEMYTCQDGAEEKSRKDSLNIIVNLRTLTYKNDIGTYRLNEKRLYNELSERFAFRERQYVIVTK